MDFNQDKIKEDILSLSLNDFYIKYVKSSHNWYFVNILCKTPEHLNDTSDTLCRIISSGLGVEFHNIKMVGSAKTGFSLAPQKDLKAFDSNSDIDIALISENLFMEFWKLFRESYSTQYKRIYRYIKNEIYRGYINERNILEIDSCRRRWKDISVSTSKELRHEMKIQHEINYRIYRNWDDFNEYNIQSINELRCSLSNDKI